MTLKQIVQHMLTCPLALCLRGSFSFQNHLKANHMNEISQVRVFLFTEHVRMLVSLTVYLFMFICFLVACPGVYRSSRVGDSVFQ